MDIFTVVLSSLKAIRKNPKFLLPAFFFVLFGVVVALILSAIFLNAIPGQVTASHQLYARIALAITKLVPFAVLAGIIIFLAGIGVKGMYIDLCLNWKRFPKRPSLRKSFNVAVSRYKDLFVYEAIALAIEAAVALVILGPLIYVTQNSIIYPYLNGIVISGQSFIGFSLVALMLIILYAILAITVTILLWLGSSIVILDHSDAISALRESIRIGKAEWLKILATLVLAYIVVAIALLVSRAFQIIPVIGIIISFIISIGIMTFIELVAPMYYIGFHKKK